MTNNKPGPTGKFPQGVFKDDDEGELKMAVGHDAGKVFMDFGEKIKWFAVDPEGARDLAKLLNDHADKAELGTQ